MTNLILPYYHSSAFWETSDRYVCANASRCFWRDNKRRYFCRWANAKAYRSYFLFVMRDASMCKISNWSYCWQINCVDKRVFGWVLLTGCSGMCSKVPLSGDIGMLLLNSYCNAMIITQPYDQYKIKFEHKIECQSRIWTTALILRLCYFNYSPSWICTVLVSAKNRFNISKPMW